MKKRYFESRIFQIEEESQIHPDLDDFFSPLELAEDLRVAKDSRRR
jgi:hypothetical protein